VQQKNGWQAATTLQADWSPLLLRSASAAANCDDCCGHHCGIAIIGQQR